MAVDCKVHRLVADVALFARNRVLLVKYKDVSLYDGQRGWFLPDDFLRFGVEFADGAKATNLPGPPGPPGEPAGPLLLQRGGGGGGSRWDQTYWVWPLPPPGPLAFVCEWPAEEISLTRAEIDAELVLGAAAKAEILWDEPESISGSGAGWVSYPGRYPA